MHNHPNFLATPAGLSDCVGCAPTPPIPEGNHHVGSPNNLDIADERGAAAITGIIGKKLDELQTMTAGVSGRQSVHSPCPAGHYGGDLAEPGKMPANVDRGDIPASHYCYFHAAKIKGNSRTGKNLQLKIYNNAKYTTL